MKNLSIQEKKDLDNCVFQALGTSEKGILFKTIQKLLQKIKSIF